jgi:hypothetical protein
VNGARGLAVARGETVTAVVSLAVWEGRITRIDLAMAPDKLVHLRVPD